MFLCWCLMIRDATWLLRSCKRKWSSQEHTWIPEWVHFSIWFNRKGSSACTSHVWMRKSSHAKTLSVVPNLGVAMLRKIGTIVFPLKENFYSGTAVIVLLQQKRGCLHYLGVVLPIQRTLQSCPWASLLLTTAKFTIANGNWVVIPARSSFEQRRGPQRGSQGPTFQMACTTPRLAAVSWSLQCPTLLHLPHLLILLQYSQL